MKKQKKYVCKSIVAVLLLMTVSLRTPEAAIQNNTAQTDTTISSGTVKNSFYKASSSDKKARNAYKKYVKEYLSSRKRFPGHYYKFRDINNDGISEMFYVYTSGVRSAYKIYTYKKGKIIKMKEPDLSGVNEIIYNKKSSQICVVSSNGASHSILTCYKMVSNKLKKISKYECISDYSGGASTEKYYKNNKRISANKYRTFTSKIFKWPNI